MWLEVTQVVVICKLVRSGMFSNGLCAEGMFPRLWPYLGCVCNF